MFQKLLTYNEPLGYFTVVVCGFCGDFLVYATLVSADVSIYIANVAGFFVGAVINVVLIRKYVFPNTRFRLVTDLPLTFAANGIMLGVGTGMLWVLVDFFGVNPYFAKLLSNGIRFFLNYTVRKIFFNKG